MSYHELSFGLKFDSKIEDRKIHFFLVVFSLFAISDKNYAVWRRTTNDKINFEKIDF